MKRPLLPFSPTEPILKDNRLLWNLKHFMERYFTITYFIKVLDIYYILFVFRLLTEVSDLEFYEPKGFHIYFFRI